MKCPYCQAENRDGYQFCSRCGAPNPGQKPIRRSQPGQKNPYIWFAVIASIFAAAAVIAVIFMSGKSSGSGLPLTLSDQNAEYQVVKQTAVYKDPDSDEETGTLMPGETVLIQKISNPDENEIVWGFFDQGKTKISDGSSVYLSELKLTKSDLYSSDSAYKALIRQPVYKNSSKLSNSPGDINAGDLLTFAETLEDQFGTVWGLTDFGVWTILQDADSVYFQKYEADESVMSEPETPEENSNHLQNVPSGNTDAYNDSYILPLSSTVRLAADDIADLSLQQLCYARNEIYARHGRRFKSQELQDYFDSQSWYSGTIRPEDFSESYLSDLEKKNIKLLKDREFSISPDGYTVR